MSRSFGQGDTTYIQALEKYYEDSTASQPEMYTALSCAMNYSVIPLYYYLLDRQLYTGMKVNEINLDTSLTRTEKDRRISNAWAEYDSDKNIALNAFIQMISDNYKTLTSYMRPYDTVPTEVTMDYAKTRELTVNRDLSNGKQSYTVTASDKTAETMGFSILKLRDGNVYAMLSDRGENQDFVLNDFISVVARSSFYHTTNVFASGDYHNLLKGSGSWSALKLINRASEFENLTGYASYSLAENNLAKYVTSVEGISGVFSAGISRDKFYGLTSNYRDNYSGLYSQDMSVVFYDLANLSDAGLDSSEEKLDLEDDIYDKDDSVKNQPVAVVMKKTADEDIVLNMHIPAVKDCNVKLQYVDRLDENGNPLEIAAADQDGNYQVIAGERIEILVKPADGKKIASAVLQGQMMDVGAQDHGRYVSFAMPAQELNIKAVFTQNAYKVTVKGISEESISITDETGSAVDLNAVHYDDVLKIKADTAKIQTLHYYQTDVSNGAAVNIPLDENGEATLFMPDMNITIEEGSVMERDEEGTYLIRTFDDLNAVSKIVQSDKKANFKLMNNISGEGQKLLQTIGSASNPYEGTFDGQGYDIFNLSIENADGDTALFGTVGTNGIVKRVNVFYHHVTGKRAAGIAAVNDGVIENSFSRGKVFAGTTDTHAVRMARIAGAIAGGIAGQNTANGTIHNVYSVNDAVSATNAGAIFGENDGGSVSQTYFLNSLPGGAEQGTAMARTAMSDGTFADVLNSQVAAGTGWNTWYAQSNRNKGFPILYTSATVQNQVQDAARGITVTGRMHGATQLQVNTLDTDSYAYKAFAAYAASHNKKIALAADAALQLADGQAAPYQGFLNLQIDLAKYSGRNFRVLVYQNGAVRELTINGENLAAFEADELAPFAVLAENTDQSGNNGSDTSGNDGSGNTGNTASDPSAVKPNGGDNASSTDTKKLTSAKTGDNSHMVLWGIVLAAAAGAAVISIGYRRKKN